MSDKLVMIDAMPPGQFVATLENVGAELARITASIAEARTLPPADAVQQLRRTEQRAEWLYHGARSAARSARFYLVWQNRFAGERFKCMRSIGEILIVLLRHQGGRPRKTLSDAEGFSTLEALFGRNAYNFSIECQEIARMPREVFDAYLMTGETADDVDDCNPQAPELTKAGLLRCGERYFESDNRSPFGPDPSEGRGQASSSDGFAGSPRIDLRQPPISMSDPLFEVDRTLDIDVGRYDIDLYEKSQTDPAMARRIVEHFNPKGRILDPCRGDGAFYNAFPETETCLWCEITQGRDFLEFTERVDWIITNWPWKPEDLYNAFARRSFALADNVVLLAHIGSVLTWARMRTYRYAGFGLKEIFLVDGKEAGFPGGLALAAFHFKRGWTEQTDINYPWSMRCLFGASAIAHGRVRAA